MAPSERANQCLREAEAGSLEAQTQVGLCHLRGAEGLEEDHVLGAALLRKAADLGCKEAQGCLGTCYFNGWGVGQNAAQAVAWWRKAADNGYEAAQFLVGKTYARGEGGMKKDLPMGKIYLELSAAQGDEDAAALLKELRECVACGKLDVHHMVCKRCYNRRYCDAGCQLWHWNHPTDPHRLHCVLRRESAGAGGSSGRVEPPAHLYPVTTVAAEAVEATAVAATAAAAAVRVTGNELFRERKYSEVRAWP